MAGASFVLQSAGWGLKGPWDWTHPCGDRYAVQESACDSDSDWKLLLEVFRETLRCSVWKTAAQHLNGKASNMGPRPLMF